MDYPITPSAIQHLSNADPMLGRLIRSSGMIYRAVDPDPFKALVSAIVAQQLSSSAADTILARVFALAEHMLPEKIMGLDESALRACGLSFQKIGYLKNISSAFLSGSLSEALFRSADDAAITAALTAVKGIGQWTAEMFLIFCLSRQDIFSYGDLGLRKGMGWVWGLPGEPSPAFAKAVSALWSPYNSTASLYLWDVTLHGFFKKTHLHVLYPEFISVTGDTDYLLSPIGWLKIVSTPAGLAEVSVCPPAAQTDSACPLIHETKKQLFEYFSGKRRMFDLPLAPEGADARKTVWAALRTVPFGARITSQALAPHAGQTVTVQAVSAATKKNRLLIITPSHRLVRADGRIVDPIQRWLLSHEARVNPSL